MKDKSSLHSSNKVKKNRPVMLRLGFVTEQGNRSLEPAFVSRRLEAPEYTLKYSPTDCLYVALSPRKWVEEIWDNDTWAKPLQSEQSHVDIIPHSHPGWLSNHSFPFLWWIFFFLPQFTWKVRWDLKNRSMHWSQKPIWTLLFTKYLFDLTKVYQMTTLAHMRRNFTSSLHRVGR